MGLAVLTIICLDFFCPLASHSLLTNDVVLICSLWYSMIISMILDSETPSLSWLRPEGELEYTAGVRSRYTTQTMRDMLLKLMKALWWRSGTLIGTPPKRTTWTESGRNSLTRVLIIKFGWDSDSYNFLFFSVFFCFL